VEAFIRIPGTHDEEWSGERDGGDAHSAPDRAAIDFLHALKQASYCHV